MTPFLPLPALTLIALLLGAPALAQTGTLNEEALRLTNAARAEAGLDPLQADPALSEAATAHAEDMLARDFYAHVSPDGQTPADRITAAGGSPWALMAENIATCSGCAVPPDADRVAAFHAGWMQSPEHRQNILGTGFDSFGFGIAGRGDRAFAVQTFSGPGADGEGPGLSPDAARATARDRVNALRAEAGLAPLDASAALDTLAARVLDALQEDAGTLPENIFGLLPEGATGWTSLGLRSALRGGAGQTVTGDDILGAIADWTGAGAGPDPLGGARASHFGFAARAGADGRLIAVAVFGGRG